MANTVTPRPMIAESGAAMKTGMVQAKVKHLLNTFFSIRLPEPGCYPYPALRMAMQSTGTNHSADDDDDDDFYDAIAEHPVSAAPGPNAAYCEHGDVRGTCAICAYNGALVASPSAADDTTKQLTLTSSQPPDLAPTLSTASADPVVSLFKHNASAFGCTLCSFSARAIADLRRHRLSLHRHDSFVDYFLPDCSCATRFTARSAATRHVGGEQCRRPEKPLAAVDPHRKAAFGGSASSPTPAPDGPPALAAAPALTVSPPPHCTSTGGKRRRLNPEDTPSLLSRPHEHDSGRSLPLAARPAPSPSARAARRTLSSRWGSRRLPPCVPDPTEDIPDTPTDGWIDVGEMVARRPQPQPPKTPAAKSRSTTRWGPPRERPVVVPPTPTDGWMVVATGDQASQPSVAAKRSPRPPIDSARTALPPHTGRATELSIPLARLAPRSPAPPDDDSTCPAPQPSPPPAPASCARPTPPVRSKPPRRSVKPASTAPRRPCAPRQVTWRDLAWPSPQVPQVVIPLTAGSPSANLPDPAVVVTISADGGQSGPDSDDDPTPMEVDFAATPPTIEETEHAQPAPVQHRRRDRHRQDAPAGSATPSPAVTTSATSSGVWLLRFDGACRGNPGLGGAGAILYSPTGAVLWRCAQYIQGTTTNNIAEYMGLLAGVEGALHHGVARLRIEGDSALVIKQVQRRIGCRSKPLLKLRRTALSQLASFASYSLHHIDRTLNKDADGLANEGLRVGSTRTTCTDHPGTNTTACWAPGPMGVPPATDAEPPATEPSSPPAPTRTNEEIAEIACRDGGEVFPTVDLGSGDMPARRAVLRLRQLTAAEQETAEAAVDAISTSLADKISTTEDWATGEGYITEITQRLYERLQPYAASGRGNQGSRSAGSPPTPARPTSCQTRLDEALSRLHSVQRHHPDDRPSIKRARRKVGRIRSAIRRQYVRGRFRLREKECVEDILRTAEETYEQDEASSPAPPAGAAAAMPTSRCPITKEALELFFTGVNTERQRFQAGAPIGRDFRAALEALPAATALTDNFERDITLEEVEEQLNHVAAASAPGLDGVGYAIFKQFAPQLLPVLLAAFKFCWKHRRVPRYWKLGVVRLLPKKGDPMRPGNWRPICLQQAIYKLYAGILARRFTRWMEKNGRHTDAQKGFRAFNGCADHNYIAAALTDDAQRKRKALYAVWYDLQNAFGSVPHAMIWFVLERLGVAPSFITRCKDLYTDAAFIISNAKDGSTSPIRQRIGVFQGCPLSPHLFTAVLIPLLLALQGLPEVGVRLSKEDAPSVTAYADDLKVFSSSRVGIKRQHDLMLRFLKWSGMRANPAKCSSLGVARASNTALEPDNVKLHINGDAIPSISMDQSYEYLGIGDGVNHAQRRMEMTPLLAQVKRQATALFQSGLAPWQVLKAYKVYLLPRLEYSMRFLRPLPSQLEGLDNHIQRGFRHLLRLPADATNELLYAPTSCGGLGLLPLAELHAAIRVAYGWQLLHSQDAQVQRIARAQLGVVVRKRHNIDETYWKGKENVMLQRFLNNKLAESPYARKKPHHSDISSLWSDIQEYLHSYALSLETAPETAADAASTSAQPAPQGPLHIRVPHFKDWLSRKTVLRHLKLHLKLKHRDRWQAMTKQGCTVAVHGGRGSAFITNPSRLWDIDYTFAMKARLDVIDTNAVLKRRTLRTHGTCRYPNCNHVETLNHVLEHCPGTQDIIRTRHDDALRLITNELEARVKDSNGRLQLRINRTVPGFNGPALRPDIQLYDKEARTAAIVDLAIPFDVSTEAGDGSGLTTARDRKLRKYKVIERHLKDRSWTVKSAAVVYGALGSVPTSNQSAYTDTLGLQKRTGKKLDRIISMAAIQGSRRIWRWHAAQHVRRQQTRRVTYVEAGTGGDPPPQGGGRQRPRPRQN